MGSGLTTTTGKSAQSGTHSPVDSVRALLDTVDKAMVVARPDGRVLIVNARGKKCLEEHGKTDVESINIFEDLLNVSQREISKRIESGENEIELTGRNGTKTVQARVRWIPESDWVSIQFANEQGQ